MVLHKRREALSTADGMHGVHRCSYHVQTPRRRSKRRICSPVVRAVGERGSPRVALPGSQVAFFLGISPLAAYFFSFLLPFSWWHSFHQLPHIGSAWRVGVTLLRRWLAKYSSSGHCGAANASMCSTRDRTAPFVREPRASYPLSP